MTADLATAANSGSAAIGAASNELGVLLETRNRDAQRASPADVLKFKQEAGRKLRSWAKVTEEKLKNIGELIERGHGLIESGEARALWRLLDQLKTDIYRYVVDGDSLLQDYEPLQRASAPQALQPFWNRFDTAFDAVDTYNAVRSKYEEVYSSQTMTEIRSFEKICRVDSHEIRNSMLKFIDLARPLMQAIGKL